MFKKLALGAVVVGAAFFVGKRGYDAYAVRKAKAGFREAKRVRVSRVDESDE